MRSQLAFALWLVSVTCVHSSPPTCPANYRPTQSACISLRTDEKTWIQARDACRAEGADLLTVLDELDLADADSEMVAMATSLAWTGLHFDQAKSKFIWSSNYPMSASFWGPGEPPLDGVNGCGGLIIKELHDIPCTRPLPYICEIRPAPTPKPTGSSGSQCPDFSFEFADACYVAKPDANVTWPEANKSCENIGMTLVSFHSKEELVAIQLLVAGGSANQSSRNISIGLEMDYFGYFVWTDETPLDFMYLDPQIELLTWMNWAKRQQRCWYMTSSGFWFDTDCQTKSGYVCKMDKE